MRTTDRNSKTLDGAAIDRHLRGESACEWSFRVVDTGGDWTSSSGWAYSELPAEAAINRSRQQQIDGGPGQLSLSLLASEIPLGTVPKVGYRIEVDRFIHGQPWPYFTGIIDSVKTGWALQDGAAVKTYEIDTLDVLMRCQNRWIDTIAITPVVGGGTFFKLTGIVKEVRGEFASTGPSTTQNIPGAVSVFDRDNLITLSANSNLSSPYTTATHYSANSAQPIAITWTPSGPALGSTVYYRYYRVEYFGIRRDQSGTVPDWVIVPANRDTRDVFFTEIAANGWNSGSRQITPKDPNPYDSDNALIKPWTDSTSTLNGNHDSSTTTIAVTDGTDFAAGDFIRIDSEVMYVSSISTNNLTVKRGFNSTTGASHSTGATVYRGQYEYLAINDGDGTEEIEEITTTSAAGVITIGATPGSLTPAEGYNIRVVSAEMYPAWEEFGQLDFVNSRINLDDIITDSETSFTASSDASIFSPGDVLRLESEQMLVVSVSGTSITVTRGHNGTTAAAHSGADDLYIGSRLQIRFWYKASTINEGAPFTSGDTTLTVADGTDFRKWQLLLIEDEILYVNDLVSGNNCPVARGAHGTTAASHADGSTVYIEVSRGALQARTDLGIAIPSGFHFDTPGSIKSLYASAAPLKGPESGSNADPNRVEEVIKDILGQAPGGLAIFADSDIRTYSTSGADWGPTGAYIKNHVRYQVAAMDLLSELKNSALPPNAYIVGERDGKIAIRPFFMDTVESGRIVDIVAIQQESAPGPATAVAVIAEGEPVNRAAAWFRSTSGMDNPGRAYDGNAKSTLSTTQTALGTRGVFEFTIPGSSPLQGFPEISEVKIFGNDGWGCVYVSQVSPYDDRVFVRYDVPEANQVDLSRSGSAVTIPGDAIARAAANLDPGSDWILGIELTDDNSATTLLPRATSPDLAAITEIEIWSKQVIAWRAELSDDTSKLPAAYQPTSPTTQFGAIFVQADPGTSGGAGSLGKRVSYLWAPSAFLKRTAAKYASAAATIKHQLKVIRLSGVSQFEVRDLAEMYLLEETYKATPYVITAPLDDRIELGDTIAVPFPDDTVKLLLVEGISDSGALYDNVASYILTDRSASNRQAA